MLLCVQGIERYQTNTEICLLNRGRDALDKIDFSICLIVDLRSLPRDKLLLFTPSKATDLQHFTLKITIMQWRYFRFNLGNGFNPVSGGSDKALKDFTYFDQPLNKCELKRNCYLDFFSDKVR